MYELQSKALHYGIILTLAFLIEEGVFCEVPQSTSLTAPSLRELKDRRSKKQRLLPQAHYIRQLPQ